MLHLSIYINAKDLAYRFYTDSGIIQYKYEKTIKIRQRAV